MFCQVLAVCFFLVTDKDNCFLPACLGEPLDPGRAADLEAKLCRLHGLLSSEASASGTWRATVDACRKLPSSELEPQGAKQCSSSPWRQE